MGQMSVVAALTLIGLSGLTSAVAQDLDTWNKIREVTRAWVADVCYTVEQKGRKSEAQLKGEVEAKARGFIAKLADLGVTASGNIVSQEHEGVSQEALAAALKESTNCRERVFNKIMDKMLPSNAPTNTRPSTLSSDISGQYEGIIVMQANTILGPMEQHLQVRLIIDHVKPGETRFHGTLIAQDGAVSSQPATIQGQLSGNHITFTARSVSDPNMYFDGSVDNNSIQGTVYGDASSVRGGGILSVSFTSLSG
jgi:hypothetical protein